MQSPRHQRIARVLRSEGNLSRRLGQFGYGEELLETDQESSCPTQTSDSIVYRQTGSNMRQLEDSVIPDKTKVYVFERPGYAKITFSCRG